MSDPRTTITPEMWEHFQQLSKEHHNRQQAEIERLRRAVAFARSVIKSGEPWTDTCEKELTL